MINMSTPLALEKLTLKNRLVMPPMATHSSTPEGYITDDLLAYYDEKTKGGHIGLVITEHCFISPEGRASAKQLSAAEDACIDGLSRLAEVIHKNGSPVFMQINHAGSANNSELTGMPVYGPTAMVNPSSTLAKEPCIEMTPRDIEKVIMDFEAAALRAKKAGMDGVEVHAAHGYLLNQFWSPITNLRTDAYGGDPTARFRLIMEVLLRVKNAVGGDFPVALRLGACDYQQFGNGLAEAQIAAALLQDVGIDLLDISGGMCRYTNPINKEPGYFGDGTAAMKEKTDIPIILTGGITTRAAGDALLAEGKADLIGVGRALLANSEWPAGNMQ